VSNHFNSDEDIYPRDKYLNGIRPDWKNRDNCYKSKRVLGKMYREISMKMNHLLKKNHSFVTPLEVPPPITDQLQEIEETKLLSMRDKALTAIKKYIRKKQEQVFSFNLEKDKYFQWRQNHFKHEREKLIYNKEFDRNRVTLVQAAVIYEQCFLLEQNDSDSSCQACEYAWGVCMNEIIEIFAGKNSFTVACQTQSYVLRK
jgi:hypothetical protein